VNIVFGDIGQVKVNYLWQLFYIQTASGDIRGNQNTNFASFKTGQCFSPCTLTFIPVNRCSDYAFGF
jgi:hypothetical protein